MSLGIECLLTDDESLAIERAGQLDSMNAERREIENEMKQQALDSLKSLHNSPDVNKVGITLYDETWHQGVVGIVASRIKDRFHRPVVAFAQTSESEVKGSGRSIPGLHMRDVFASIDARFPGLIEKFGGHAMAAGLSMPRESLATFQQAFDQEAERVLSEEALTPAIFTDGELDTRINRRTRARIKFDLPPGGRGSPNRCLMMSLKSLSRELLAADI